MATFHEMLAIVRVAQETHAKPESEGGHDGPLNIHCFLAAVRLNARAMGFRPGDLVSSFKFKFPVLVERGWIAIADRRCGGEHFALTDAGLEQLEEWNRLGCKSHEVGRGQTARNYGRKCSGAARLKSPDYSTAA